MNRFFMAFVRAARWVAIGLAVLGLAALVGFLTAPELVWSILLYTLIFLGGAAAVYLLIRILRTYRKR